MSSSTRWRTSVVLLAVLAVPADLSGRQASELTVTMVGNAGVLLSDGATSLLVDLPYEPGAFGYMRYRPDDLDPQGTVLSVITHHHRDHFDPGLFAVRAGWAIVGPPSVVSGLPAERITRGDSVVVGSFSVIVVPTPHTKDHRSYRIRWRGRMLYFVGDTEDPSHLLSEQGVDLLFITPWLSCNAARSGGALPAGRSIAYHESPDGSDRVCGRVERLNQGATFTLSEGAGRY